MKRYRVIRGGSGWVLVLMLFGATGSFAQAVTTAAELVTSTQHLWVNVRTTGQGIKIYVAQVDPAATKAALPDGFRAVANIQIFDQARLDKITASKGTDTQYANAIPRITNVSKSEIVSFDPPMVILLGNPDSAEVVSRIGVLAGKGEAKKWIVWDGDASAEARAAVIEQLKKEGFDVSFSKGAPAKMYVVSWPSGDPSVGH